MEHYFPFSALRLIAFRPETDDGSPDIGHALSDETKLLAQTPHPRRRSLMVQTTASNQSAAFPQGSSSIRVEHLTRAIATRKQRTIILDDVTLTIPAQSLFAISGPSARSKSAPTQTPAA